MNIASRSCVHVDDAHVMRTPMLLILFVRGQRRHVGENSHRLATDGAAQAYIVHKELKLHPPTEEEEARLIPDSRL